MSTAIRTVKDLAELHKEPWPEGQGFIQWKGTDVCLDFHCPCGHHNHYDGYFAYSVVCAGCQAVYGLNTYVELVKLSEPDPNDQPLTSNEPE